jgi:3-phenylpropionate/trans-cinnamate dioxygenase ferredoxin subunit
MTEPFRVGVVDDIAPGEALVVDAGTLGTEDSVAVFHSDNGMFYALNDTCSHETASLADGWIEGTEVECPLHAAKFCMMTGKALCLPANVDVVAHRIEVQGDELWLHLAQHSNTRESAS